jgi:CBS-domain-containing membrane protein
MDRLKPSEPQAERRRLSRAEELRLALLPTATVLVMLGLVEAFGQQRLLFASLASSALLIYLDPKHEMNAVRTLVISQVAAAGVGWAMFSLLGPGYLSAGTAMVATIGLMILFDAVHPPAASTALTFALQAEDQSSLVLFELAVGLTAVVVLLQRAVVCLIGRRSALTQSADAH